MSATAQVAAPLRLHQFPALPTPSHFAEFRPCSYQNGLVITNVMHTAVLEKRKQTWQVPKTNATQSASQFYFATVRNGSNLYFLSSTDIRLFVLDLKSMKWSHLPVASNVDKFSIRANASLICRSNGKELTFVVLGG